MEKIISNCFEEHIFVANQRKETLQFAIKDACEIISDAILNEKK